MKAPISLIAFTLAGTKPARPQDRTLKPVSWTLPPPQPSPNAGFPRTFDQLPNPSPLAHTCQIYIIFDPSLQRTRETAKTCDSCIIYNHAHQSYVWNAVVSEGINIYARFKALRSATRCMKNLLMITKRPCAYRPPHRDVPGGISCSYPDSTRYLPRLFLSLVKISNIITALVQGIDSYTT